MSACTYCPLPREAGPSTGAKSRNESASQSAHVRRPEPQPHVADSHGGTFPSRLMLGVTATLVVAFLGIFSAIMLDNSVKGMSFATEPAGVSTDGALPAAEAIANWLDSDPVAQNAARTVLVTYAR
ncbi:hypothetical protein [Pararobbsia alpina]|uniref:Uncharacterized protein n=1 Tax=Pararobbsia alpina TaxID=621374 RepID=A0A6S7B4W8_9BURK|nr:hypothetical protein [Pararobbsia alpina]CAB3780493.1 hypothetical protein LMG28138_01053 [Pararobbsia alpina]